MKLPGIVDSHVHLWDPARLRYAWLTGLPALNQNAEAAGNAPAPGAAGRALAAGNPDARDHTKLAEHSVRTAFSARARKTAPGAGALPKATLELGLNRAFPPAEFATATKALPVEKIIVVESGCDPGQGLAEAAWFAALAKHEPRLRGIVAQAPLEKGHGVLAELDVLAAMPLVKGVRRLLQSETDPVFCQRPEFLAGVKLLEKFGFTFDLCIRHEQLPDATALVRQVPQVTFVLDHLGKPGVRNHQIEPWSKNLQALAALPNVVCKISGLTTEADHDHWQPGELKIYLERALEYFGSDRVLFGGDWPVARLATSYERWLETVYQAFAATGDAGLVKLFKTNAERIYRV